MLVETNDGRDCCWDKEYVWIKRTLWHMTGMLSRGQTEPDNPAEYGFIRKRIIPLGIKRIAKKIIRFRLLP